MTGKNLAVITARGGSKRIPRKNIKIFCGKPIITYSIEAAIGSGVFDEVIVSTDDEEIKNIAIKYGAKVPFMRSEKTSDDYAMTYEVLLEVLEQYKKIDMEFEYLCCIYPTAPFIKKEILKTGIDIIKNYNADTVLPIVPFSFPPQRSFIIENDNVKFKYSENELIRSQDLETLYHDAGQFYYVNVKRFIETKRIIMDNVKPIILDDIEVQDIDNESDWEIAELKYQMISDKYYK